MSDSVYTDRNIVLRCMNGDGEIFDHPIPIEEEIAAFQIVQQGGKVIVRPESCNTDNDHIARLRKSQLPFNVTSRALGSRT